MTLLYYSIALKDYLNNKIYVEETFLLVSFDDITSILSYSNLKWINSDNVTFTELTIWLTEDHKKRLFDVYTYIEKSPIYLL